MELITLADAARRCPGHVHLGAVWRWARVGLKARDGNQVRLRHVRVGGRLYTTQQDLDAFFSALAEADTEHFDSRTAAPATRSGHRPRSSKRREREIAAADARLAARGA